MPIIKNYHLGDGFDESDMSDSRFGAVIKSSVLSSVEHVVTPGQLTDDASTQLDDNPFDSIQDESVGFDDVSLEDVSESDAIDETKIQERVQEDLKSNIDDLMHAINGLKDARDQVIESAEDQLVELSLLVAEKIVQKQIEMDPTIIKSVVEDTLNKISGSDRITFKIHPSDADVFNEFQPYLESRLIGVEKISIQQDATIDQGGCIIETDLGFLDVTIREKLNIIAQTFKKVKLTL